MAIVRYRKNTISSIPREDGSVAVEQQEKAGLLWNSFKR
jgi:hypothetical protein